MLTRHNPFKVEAKSIFRVLYALISPRTPFSTQSPRSFGSVEPLGLQRLLPPDFPNWRGDDKKPLIGRFYVLFKVTVGLDPGHQACVMTPIPKFLTPQP